MTIYGIPNCDTIKKTLDWFKANKIEYDFHDYKKLGIEKAKLQNWFKQVGIENIINKKSTSWKALDAEEQASITKQAGAITVILKNPSIIKRPIIEDQGEIVMIGFKADEYDQKLKNL